jgi:hypothetical protein
MIANELHQLIAADALTALQARIAETEERFWRIVDQHGPSLPSDMWDALNTLVTRDAAHAARIDALTAERDAARETERRLMNDLQAHKDALAQGTHHDG